MFGTLHAYVKATLLAGKMIVLCCALAALSSWAKADDAPADKEACRVVEFFPQPTGSEKKILEALAKPTTIDFVETSLSDVVDYLKDAHGIEIQLDKKALEDQGVGSDSQVTRKLAGVPLRSALRLILPELGMGFVIAHDVLLITTLEVEDAEAVTRTYPVGDLVRADNYTALRNAITSTVRPDTWHQVGGPGQIEVLEESKSIVISQTQRAHDEVLELLRSLRAAKAVAKDSGQLLRQTSN
ncbi:MAG TPA: hypothetical protein VL175_13275 [Pirellulales bacterium]|jgi:hypothetical protein|nr:hypothetical protein [Pirellulales bacterium]